MEQDIDFKTMEESLRWLYSRIKKSKFYEYSEQKELVFLSKKKWALKILQRLGLYSSP